MELSELINYKGLGRREGGRGGGSKGCVCVCDRETTNKYKVQ